MSHASHANHPITTTHIFLVSAVLLGGCVSPGERAVAAQIPGQQGAFAPQEEEEEPRASAPQTQQAGDAQGEPRTQVYADLALLAACGLEAPTLYFEYDSAHVRRAGEADLTELADCLQRSPLAERQIEVIGHADARGTEPYNEDLGMRRATAVTEELMTAGLERTRVRARSMGEQKADPPDHWDDRRVVIRLVDEPAAK